MPDDPTVETYETLEGQTALVTGATRGIGAATADALVDLDTTVYAGARDTDDVDADDRRAVELDVTEEAEIAAAVDRIADETGRLDVLVNNAGVFPEAGPLHGMDTADFDRTMAVNLRGPTLVTKHALGLLREREGARVVTLSSGLGRFTGGEMGGNYPPYRLSKVGVAGLTAYLHAEYGSEGLIANAVDPGWVRTDMGGPNANRSPAEGADTPVWLSRFRPGSTGGRLWRDREVVGW
jgi:NAD(P)-dependent dehydrogenase (short-subunit alcohol dehydrogenase family)